MESSRQWVCHRDRPTTDPLNFSLGNYCTTPSEEYTRRTWSLNMSSVTVTACLCSKSWLETQICLSLVTSQAFFSWENHTGKPGALIKTLHRIRCLLDNLTPSSPLMTTSLNWHVCAKLQAGIPQFTLLAALSPKLHRDKYQMFFDKHCL